MITIIGGGIGGLTTALALQRAGVEARVWESSPGLRAVGAGLWLPPNAMAVLDELGVAADVIAAGVPLARAHVSDTAAGVLTGMDMKAAAERLGHTTVAVRRSRLQEVLLSALEPGTLRLGQRFTRYHEDGDVVTARFSDGSTASGALLVGADGIHSAVRQQAFPGSNLRYSGQTCYRGLAAMRAHGDLYGTGAEIWGGSHRFGYSAVDMGTVYWFAPVLGAAGGAVPADVKAHLLEAYAHFPPPVPDILAATEEDAILQTDLYDLAPLPGWCAGRVALLGDAAHASTPNLGQGGAQAMEDALALARRVTREGATPAALQSYWQARRRRAGMIVSRSRTFGRMAHWTHPAARALRNVVLRSVPARLQARQIETLFTPVL
jgi:2-polyprenyl-6-methoxyphenol hydroxylase-like FAD-dependent oxidoreductase